MSGKAEGRAPGQGSGPGGGESLEEVLASIRSLVAAESRARQAPGSDLTIVLVLTPQMRVETAARSGEILTEGMEARHPRAQAAPILDEEALRDVVNAIVREELQGELGDRISRNLRKLIRRELAQLLEERRED
jgi:hypothetical protein